MEKEFIDYYRVLGITPEATEEQIKKAYRQLVKRYHPDCYQGSFTKEDLHIRITSINAAFEILGDEAKKKQYDILYKQEKEREENVRRAREERQRKEREASERCASQNQAENQFENSEAEMEKEEKGFFESIRDSYKEVRDDEKKNSFQKRHRRLSRNLYKKNGRQESIPDLLTISFKNGTIHIGYELLYQLYKLSYITKDNTIKYVIRNRRTIAALVLAGALLSTTGKTMEPTQTTEITDAKTYTTMSPEQPTASTEPYIVLTRYYTIRTGDTLSQISSESNTTINKIKSVNGLDSSTIYIGQTLKVPYYVKDYELQYYTESIPVEGKTLQQIADEKNTDINTLIKLNEEAIVKDENGTYKILSDNIIVPNFITPEELRTLKEEKQYK